MAVILKTLNGSEIPDEYSRPGLETLYQVECQNGEVHYRESDTEAAALTVALTEQEKQAKR